VKDHPQLEKLKEVIHKARWIDGEIPTDEHLAKAVLDAGFVIPQVTLPTPVKARIVDDGAHWPLPKRPPF